MIFVMIEKGTGALPEMGGVFFIFFCGNEPVFYYNNIWGYCF